MIMEFIVLGLIPGTHIQITFSWFLVAGIVADVLFGVFFLYTSVLVKSLPIVSYPEIGEPRNEVTVVTFN